MALTYEPGSYTVTHNGHVAVVSCDNPGCTKSVTGELGVKTMPILRGWFVVVPAEKAHIPDERFYLCSRRCVSKWGSPKRGLVEASMVVPLDLQVPGTAL